MKYSVIGLVAVVLFLGTVGVRDAEAVKLGPLVATPYIDATANYDDNVFVQNKGSEQDDWYFLITPGALLKLRQRDNTFELEYTAYIYRYVDTHAVNDVEDQSVRALAHFDFPGGASLHFDDLFSKSHEPRSSANLAVTGLASLSRYYSNNLTAEASYELSDRFKTSLTYNYLLYNYKLAVNDFRDRDVNSGALTVFYKFLPKTSVLLEGLYKNIYHNDDKSPVAATLNSDEYWAMTGLTWDITEKSTGSVKAGYEWKKFRSPGRKDFGGGVYQVSIAHQFTPKTSVGLSGTRQANETDDPAVAYSTTTNGYVECRYKPMTKVEIKPYASYSYDRYSDASTVNGVTARRLDRTWTGGLKATYNMQKWLAFSAGYTHSKRASNMSFYDFTDNLTMFEINVSM